MKKFNVGDVVEIKSWEEMEKEYGLDEDGDIDCGTYFVQDMKSLCGYVGTITEIYDVFVSFEGEEDHEVGNWCISFGMIKHVEDKEVLTSENTCDIIKSQEEEEVSTMKIILEMQNGEGFEFSVNTNSQLETIRVEKDGELITQTSIKNHVVGNLYVTTKGSCLGEGAIVKLKSLGSDGLDKYEIIKICGSACGVIPGDNVYLSRSLVKPFAQEEGKYIGKLYEVASQYGDEIVELVRIDSDNISKYRHTTTSDTQYYCDEDYGDGLLAEVKAL